MHLSFKKIVTLYNFQSSELRLFGKMKSPRQKTTAPREFPSFKLTRPLRYREKRLNFTVFPPPFN